MTKNPFSLEGMTILVTGASSGIGKATAIQMSLQGGVCLLSGRDEGRLRETCRSLSGDGHLSLPGDLADEDFVPEMIAHAVSESGPLSGFVHCAGLERTLPFRSTSLEDLHELMRVNLDAFWMVCKEILRKEITKRLCGRNRLYSRTIRGFRQNRVSASKGALISLIRTLAVEYASKGIRFNCVCPIRADPHAEKLKALYSSEEEFDATMNRMIPVSESRKTANAVAFLEPSGAMDNGECCGCGRRVWMCVGIP